MCPREAKYRKEDILAEIVEAYLELGVPIASQLIVERGLSCSSATIRNIMAELTEEGFLAQPHTSAGRIPTEKAYRYYLDYIVEVGPERRKVDKDVRRAEKEIEKSAEQVDRIDELLKITADIISELAHQTGMGVVWGNKDIYMHGRNYIVDYQEFQDIQKIKDLLTVLESEDVIYEIFWRDLRDRVDVFIGEEIGLPETRDCSLIISYCGKINDRETRLGLLGPMRMDYERNIALMQEISRELEELWDRF